MNYGIRHLRGIVAVAQFGSFTQAAQALSLSQPALTISIGQFEDQLGVKLFERTTRRVRPTAEGEAFLPQARRVVEDFDTAIEGLREAAQGRQGRVGVAALPSVAVRLLPRIVARFAALHPDVQVHLHDDNASGVQDRVRHGAVDFGIASRWQPSNELSYRPLIKDPFGLVCRADHPLAKDTTALPWRALAGHAFLGLAPDTGIQPLLQSVKNLPDNLRRPQFEVSNLATLEGMLEEGLGITALPALAVPVTHGAGFVFRRLVRPVVEREICLITRRGRSLSPVAQGLRDLIAQAYPGQ